MAIETAVGVTCMLVYVYTVTNVSTILHCIFWFQALTPETRSAEVEIKDQTLRQFMLSQYDFSEENSAKLFDEFGMKRSVWKRAKLCIHSQLL